MRTEPPYVERFLDDGLLHIINYKYTIKAFGIQIEKILKNIGTITKQNLLRLQINVKSTGTRRRYGLAIIIFLILFTHPMS